MFARRNILVLFLLAVSAGGCGPPVDMTPPTDIASTNAVRRSIGIREVKPEWEYDGRSKWNEQKWGAPGGGLRKIATRDDETDKIVWEQDYYLSGKSFPDPEGGTLSETLTVRYDYRSSMVALAYSGEDPAAEKLIATLTLREPHSHFDRGKTNAETLAIAIEILKMWNQSLL